MDKKKLSALFIICIANALIYTLPYLQSTYYDSMMAAYGFSHIQMGNLIGVYGMCNMAAYLFGGVAADIFDTKKLFVFSLAATGITGLYSATLPPYTMMLLLSIFWSVSTILTFWPAMLKAVKNIAEGAHRGRVFSFKELVCCLLTLLFSVAALAIFRFSDENFVALVVFYSLCHIAVAVAVAVFMPSEKPEGSADIKSIVTGVVQVVKLKGVWLVGMTIFFSQLASIIFGRFTPFLTNIGGLSASTVALITIIATNGFANIGTLAGGRISDAIGSPACFISCTMALCGVVAVVFVMLPWGSETVILCVAVCILFRIINGALRSVLFATMSQVDIPRHLSGTASGVISIIGYMPDVFTYTLCGMAMEKFRPVAAYRVIFGGLVVCCIMGSAVSAVLHRYAVKLKNS